MKNNRFLVLLASCILVMPGCFHNSDYELVEKAENLYQACFARYKDIAAATSHQEVVTRVRLIGSGSAISLGKVWRDSLQYSGEAAYSKSTPLHRAVYFMEHDLEKLESCLELLELRLLDTYSIYISLESLRNTLRSVIQTIQALPLFTKEEQLLVRYELERNRMYENSDQMQPK